MLPVQLVMSGMMSPSGFDWGSMWLYMALPSVVVGAAIVLIVFLFFRYGRNNPQSTTQSFGSTVSIGPIERPASNFDIQSNKNPLGEVFRSLYPTLMDDEKRVMGELAGAGQDVLQSDLPRMTGFSKATVSKVIHSLEVRGIVVRERHKWTYWCKINPRLVDRVNRGEMVPPASRDLGQSSQD